MQHFNRDDWPPAAGPTRLQALSFRGELKEIAIIGNGKDSELRVTAPDGRGFVIPLGGARTKITCGGNITVTTHALDDLSLIIRYAPHPGSTMRLAHAEIDYPGSEEDWKADSGIWSRMDHASGHLGSRWCVSGVRMALVADA